MRLSKFEVINQRSVKLASCEKVPPLMVIAGPNGTGKSTLLNSIRSQAGYSNMMYVAPHRAMRRQQVQQRHLLVPSISFEAVLSSPSVPGFEGIRMLDGSRDPWGYDDSANYLKHALCQIEVDRQQAITAKVDRDDGIAHGTLGDPWKPLRELTHNLLPHLSFVRIDTSNRTQVQVLWKVHGLELLVDLDDLSSGEKSIVQMFYPLIERDIKALVKEIESGPQTVERPELCVLIDEPELHLHPNLQLKVLDYLRVLTSGTHTQVILATHSPTMVEYATFEELFLLRPIELVPPEQNQLVQVATDEERLKFLREAFGSTTNLTALQPIVVVEGVAEQDAVKGLPDRKLYRALHQGFDKVTVIPGGGKAECKALLKVLDGAMKQFSNRLQAVALLDRDIDTASAEGQIQLLPVSMIENFLLDPDSIWEALQSVIERTAFKTVDDVGNALDAIIQNLTETEVGRRTASQLGNVHFYPPTTVTDISSATDAFVLDVTQRYSSTAIRKAEEFARDETQNLEKDCRRREEFDGKAILRGFFKAHIHNTGLSKVVFTFEAARHARRRRSVVNFFDEFFARLLSEQK